MLSMPGQCNFRAKDGYQLKTGQPIMQDFQPTGTSADRLGKVVPRMRW